MPENSGLQERHAKAGCERKEESRIHRSMEITAALGSANTTTEEFVLLLCGFPRSLCQVRV